MIRISGVDRTYAGDRVPSVEALENVCLDIKKEEFVSLVGPSGCGKTTLLKIIAGLYRPTRGQVWIEGTTITAPRKDIGLVFQRPILLPWRTVLQNVMLPVEVLRLESERFRRRALDLLSVMDLGEFKDHYPHQLSGGMQQRVAIARALTHDPAILLMDEPFGSLDAMTREALNLELLRIWGATQKTILFVTHSITEAILLSNRVAIMSQRPGTIIEVVGIDLPFPRTLGMMSSPSFGEYAATIRALLETRS
ncbi:MAG: ABC transporter ATP-binding protein [Candidatus Rokubacteria bacterium]|nr:ABC transporter ATP-binding protein [Candidatus Rokubacteria bacterium]